MLKFEEEEEEIDNEDGLGEVGLMINNDIIDYYYNPNVKCTCKAIFADTHKGWCHRRIRPRNVAMCR